MLTVTYLTKGKQPGKPATSEMFKISGYLRYFLETYYLGMQETLV